MTDQNTPDIAPESPEEPDFAESGRLLFAREAEFIWAATSVENLPP